MRYGSFCLLPWDVSNSVSSWARRTSNLALPNISSAVMSAAAADTACTGPALHQIRAQGSPLGRAALTAIAYDKALA